MRFLYSLFLLLGASPHAARGKSARAAAAHTAKRGQKVDRQALVEEMASAAKVHTWRNRRWIVLILVNLLFTLSFWFDIQILEGSLTASRFLGFHMADPYSSALIALAEWHVPVNLIIGTVTVMLLWGTLGGRSFCAWVCPYHLVAELAEMLHLALAKRHIVRDHAFHRGLRTMLALLFAAMAALTGFTLFLTLNPIGILSRAMVYGPSLALGWVLLLLLFEIVYSRRAWCRYVCPIGLTYGALGLAAPVRVAYRLDRCAHDGACRRVCLVPHVLEMTIKGKATNMVMNTGADCTRCGLCLDVCPTKALDFNIKGLTISEGD